MPELGGEGKRLVKASPGDDPFADAVAADHVELIGLDAQSDLVDSEQDEDN